MATQFKAERLAILDKVDETKVSSSPTRRWPQPANRAMRSSSSSRRMSTTRPARSSTGLKPGRAGTRAQSGSINRRGPSTPSCIASTATVRRSLSGLVRRRSHSAARSLGATSSTAAPFSLQQIPGHATLDMVRRYVLSRELRSGPSTACGGLARDGLVIGPKMSLFIPRPWVEALGDLADDARVTVHEMIRWAIAQLLAMVAEKKPFPITARGGRKPRFALGSPRYDRPMWSLLYLVVRALLRHLVNGSSSAASRSDAPDPR